jgi:hypothetical protein
MNIPPQYQNIRKSLPDEVSFGAGGIELFPAAEIERLQVGYSVKPDGSSLCAGDDGAWQPTWIVIGKETGLGDPIFIDSSSAALPVYTAMHGEGIWESNPVASTAEAFAGCFNELSRIAAGRANPAELDANPLRDDERAQFLARIAELNGTSIAPEFWDLILEF